MTMMIMMMIIYCPLVAYAFRDQRWGTGVNDLAGNRVPKRGQTRSDPKDGVAPSPTAGVPGDCPQTCISNPCAPGVMNSNNNNSIYLSYDGSGRVSWGREEDPFLLRKF